MNTPQPTPPLDLDAALAADAAALQQRQQAQRRANAEPLPGPLAGAFAAEPLQVLGITLRPVVAGDFILLKKLDSPLYRRTFELAEHQRRIKAGEIPADAPLPATNFDEEECVEMIWQFTVPLPVARAALRKGREHFRETALQAITDQSPVDALPQLVEAVVANFTAAFSTAVEYEGAAAAEGEETVFTTPAAAGATASAGGSTTSRGSRAAIPPVKTSSLTISP